MRKPRHPSRFAALSKAQLETLEHWLTVENIIYREAVKRCQAQFNFKTSIRALSEFYQSHFAAIGIAQHAPRPALLTIEISFHGPDKIQLRVLPSAEVKGRRNLARRITRERTA